MKHIVLILIILSTFQSYGQKWYLDKIDVSKEYSYKYKFKFENLEDSSYIQIDYNYGQSSSTFEMYDILGDTAILVDILLTNKNTDSIIKLNADFRGQAKVKLNPGEYFIEVNGIKYDKFEYEFILKDEHFINLKAYLGLSPDLYGYYIVSKNKLEEMEIQKIIECVKMNKVDFYQKCSDKNKYLILKEI